MTAIATAMPALLAEQAVGRRRYEGSRAEPRCIPPEPAIRRPRLTPVRTTRALVRTMRPRQWVKNLLVLAAPFAAGSLLEPERGRTDARSPSSRSAWSPRRSTSSTTAPTSRPTGSTRTKRARPIAAGELSIRQGLRRVRRCWRWPGWPSVWPRTGRCVALLVTYLALQVAYALWLKHEPVLDLAVVTSGFLLRAVAGGLAAGLPISQWFLLVAGLRVAVHRERASATPSCTPWGARPGRGARWCATPTPTCASCGASRRRRRSCPTACGPSRTTRTWRSPGTPSRSRRS